MRRLGQELGVEAMSLYHHVANKEALLDGMVDAVVGELNAEVGAGRRGGGGARLGRGAAGPDPHGPQGHAAPQVAARRAGDADLAECSADRATTRACSPPCAPAGFSNDLAHHTLHALGSRAIGFSQELFDPAKGGGDVEMSEAEMTAMAESFPHLTAMMAEVAHEGPDTTIGWCDDQTEFEFGLDVVLDGLRVRLG